MASDVGRTPAVGQKLPAGPRGQKGRGRCSLGRSPHRTTGLRLLPWLSPGGESQPWGTHVLPGPNHLLGGPKASFSPYFLQGPFPFLLAHLEGDVRLSQQSPVCVVARARLVCGGGRKPPEASYGNMSTVGRVAQACPSWLRDHPQIPPTSLRFHIYTVAVVAPATRSAKGSAFQRPSPRAPGVGG